jgi:hypothetical protein
VIYCNEKANGQNEKTNGCFACGKYPNEWAIAWNEEANKLDEQTNGYFACGKYQNEL